MHGPICGLLLAEEILEGEASTVDIAPLCRVEYRTVLQVRGRRCP